MNNSVSLPRSLRALALGLLALSLTLALSASAHAATSVSVSANKTLTVTGDTNDNVITVSYSAGQYVVEDASGSLTSGGSPCILIASNKVSCDYDFKAPPQINVALKEGMDQAVIASSVPSTVTARVTGVYSVFSSTAPLDATIDDSSLWVSAMGGSAFDKIEFQSPNACSVYADGGAGDDQISIDVETRDDNFELGCGAEASSVTGGAGDDLINAESSKVDISYEASAGHDVFIGGSGNDHITVGDGPDWAFGGAGQDRFYDNGGGDPSKLWGGSGNDVFTDWDYNDLDVSQFDGGSGFDTAEYHNLPYSNAGVTASIDGQFNDGVSGETDNIDTSVENMGVDWVYGNTGRFNGNDTLTGSAQPNSLWAWNGDDVIDGAGGQDDLRGGDGNDSITGGSGPDLLYGEGGNDEIFAEDGETAGDTISCGPGTDIAHADANDSVSADCETVL